MTGRNWVRAARPVAGLCLVWMGGWAVRAEEPDAARWAAPDAVLFARAARPEAALDRLESDRVRGLLKAVPGLEDGLKRPEVARVREVAGGIASALGTTPEEALRKLIGGGLTLAVEPGGAEPRAFVVATPKDAAFLESAHAKVLTLARDDAKANGRPDPVAESSHRGITVYSVGPREAHAIVEGSLVIANGPAPLKAVIDRALDDSARTLADDDGFAARRKDASPDALLWAYARTDGLRAMDPKRYAGKPDAGAVFLFGPWIEALQKGDWATLQLDWTDRKLAARLRVGTPSGGYSDAMKRYLPPKDGAAREPIEVPNLIAAGSLWRDLSAIWEVRSEIFPPETVQGLAQLDTQAGTFFGGRDFGTGVLGALGTRWNVVVADQDFAAMDPPPDTKLPAFAVILDLKPDDEEFAIRLKSAFQSFIGLVNLGAAQSKAPPLMLGSESVDGLSISTAKFLGVKDRPAGEPVNSRHNFTPSAVQVDNFFVISSSLGLAKGLIPALRKPREATDSTLVLRASGPAVASILERNRSQIVMQNMLEKGNAKEAAEAEFGLLLDLLRYLGRGSLSASDREDSAVLSLDFQLDPK